MTKADDLSILNEANRDMIRSMVDNRIWIAIGKFSGALFAGVIVVFGLIFYTYNQGESYTNEKLTVLIKNYQTQEIFNTAMLRSMDELKFIAKNTKAEIAHNTIAIEREKKNRERDIMDIRKLITTIGAE